MLFWISFLSISIAASLTWIAFIISFFSKNIPSEKIAFILQTMGLFLPLVVITFSICLVFIVFEIKKNQLIMKDWIKAFKRDILNDTQTVHAQVGALLEEEIKKEEAPAVLHISQDEPISKYQDMQLPEDVEVHFKA